MQRGYQLNFTARWSEMFSRPGQCRLWDSAARFKIVPAGRRSGKTEIAKRQLVLALVDAQVRGRADARYFAAAPTREQAKRIWWGDLKALTPPGWLDGEPRETDLCIRTRWGAELWVIGLDKPQRMEGTPWDGGVIDEIADCRPGTWDAHIRPALADRGGWAWLIGVPDRDGPGQVEYKRMYDQAVMEGERNLEFGILNLGFGREDSHGAGVSGGLGVPGVLAVPSAPSEWAAFHWASSDVLPAAEVEALRQSMDAEMFRQEIEGQFVLGTGLAFPDFDPGNGGAHVNAAAVYDPALPLCWSLDFNVNPMCSGILQLARPPAPNAQAVPAPARALAPCRVLQEFTLANSSTDAACDAFLDWCARNRIVPHNVRIYGDPTGNARTSTTGASDWAIVHQRLRAYDPKIKVRLAPWPLKDTLNATRARLRSASGAVGLVIHPSCRQLIRDLREATWPSDLQAQHALAWLRYFCIWEHPVAVERQEEEEGRMVYG